MTIHLTIVLYRVNKQCSSMITLVHNITYIIYLFHYTNNIDRCIFTKYYGFIIKTLFRFYELNLTKFSEYIISIVFYFIIN